VWIENSPVSPPSGIPRFSQSRPNTAPTRRRTPVPYAPRSAVLGLNCEEPERLHLVTGRYRGVSKSQVTVFYALLPKADANQPPFRHVSARPGLNARTPGTKAGGPCQSEAVENGLRSPAGGGRPGFPAPPPRFGHDSVAPLIPAGPDGPRGAEHTPIPVHRSDAPVPHDSA
jgi:hypothetical protein